MFHNEEIRKLNFNDSFVNPVKNNSARRHFSGSNLEERLRHNINFTSEINQQLSDINEKMNSWLLNVPSELLLEAKVLVNEAIKNKMIFSIMGPYAKIRNILCERGWIEKKIEEKTFNGFHYKSKSTEVNLQPHMSGDLPSFKNESKIDTDQQKYDGKTFFVNRELYEIASQLVSNCSPDFIWSLKLTQIDEKSIKPNQIINHFKNAGSFTTKTGLIKSFTYLPWYEKDPDEVFPRSYIISDDDEKKAFLDYYYLCGCLSLLRLITELKELVSENDDIVKINHSETDVCNFNNSKSQIKKVKPYINYRVKEVGQSEHYIDQKFSEFAINYCQLYLKTLLNKDLDNKEFSFCTIKKWEEFFENFWNVTFDGYGIRCSEKIQNKAKELCEEFKKIHRQYDLNGTKNIWIVKPGAKSRGRGISCISRFQDLQNILKSNSETIIVQKYIERPLLIYNTKFDIRQWFLVTSWSPLTIWWYKDSYIRFCSQQFTLIDFNESVHLSNNSIQHKYQNGPRSKNLPISNMWEWENFEKYLNEHGYENRWRKEILPSMKNTIIDILLCSQEKIEDRKNSFELYGADFMITDGDLKTWLLEINSSPCMAPSTEVTARLTKSVLEDIIKVILDYPKNMYCDTGQFELLYKQSPFFQSIIDKCNSLVVIGNGIKKSSVNYHGSNPDTGFTKNTSESKVINENSILKYKLRQVLENNEAYLYSNKFDQPVRKHHYRVCKTLGQEIKNITYQPVHRKSSLQCQFQNITIKSNEYLKNPISASLINYTVDHNGAKVFIKKNDVEEKTLPTINTRVSKSIDKHFPKNQKLEKYTKTGYLYDNSDISKMHYLRNCDGINNKRIDQLLKAYMPNLAK